MDRDRFSHRDRRADRAVEAGAAGLAAAVVALIGIASAASSQIAGLLAVFALAVSGGAFVAYGRRVTDRYLGDLRSVSSDPDVRSPLRAEVESDVGLERRPFRPSARSPNVRRPLVRPPTTPAVSADSRHGLRVRAQPDLQ